MVKTHENNVVSTNKKTLKETPVSKKKISFEEELFKDLEWKEDPIFTFGLLLLFMHEIFVFCSFRFLLRTTSCPVGSPHAGQWLFHCGSVVGLVFAWIVDKGTNKFDFVLFCSTILFVLTLINVIVLIFVGGGGSVFCTTAHFVYVFVDASMGTSSSFFLEQVKYLKFHLDTDYMLFIVIWGSFFIAASFTVVYQLIIHFFGPLLYYYVISILSVIFSINKVIILLLIARRVFRPTVMFNFPFMVVLYSVLKIKSGFKKLAFIEENRQRLTIPLGILLICEQFWKVAGILLFAIPFGISSLLVINAWESAWNMSEEMFVYCRNFTAFYHFSTTALFPLYFFCLYIHRKKYGWLTTELRQMGIGNILVILSIFSFTVMNIHIKETQFPLPSEGYAQIRFFNMLNTTTMITFRYMQGKIGPYAFATFSKIKMDGSLLNNAIKVINVDYGINYKTSIFGSNGKSICYCINEKEIMYLGVEPLVSSKDLHTKSTTVYIITDITNIQLKIQSRLGGTVFLTNGAPFKLTYTRIEKGIYNISAQYKNITTTFHSANFKDGSFYAILVTSSSSGLVFRIFTTLSPRFAPIEGMVIVAALLGLGNSIVLFAAVRFILNECSPMLYTTVVAISYVCLHLVSFVHSFLNLNKIFGDQSITLHLALTASLIFLVCYIYAAMSYKYFGDTTFEIVRSPPADEQASSPIIDISEEASKDTLNYN